MMFDDTFQQVSTNQIQEAPRTDETLRLYGIIRTDIGLTPEQKAVQLSHAIKTPLFYATLENPELAKSYMNGSYGTNVLMRTRSLHHLLRAYDEAKAAGLFCYLIEEDMYPEPGVKTITGLGIGPATREQTDKILKRFNLL